MEVHCVNFPPQKKKQEKILGWGKKEKSFF